MKTQDINKLLIITLMIGLGLSCEPQTQENKIPVTSKSEDAINLYEEAMVLMEKVYFAQALDKFKEALNEDPDFFMPAYRLAFYSLYQQDMESFKKYANQAIQANAKLSEAEELMRSAIEELLENQKADITSTGREIIALYPNDKESYLNHAFYLYFMDDTEGYIQTLNDAMKVTEDAATLYNAPGYAYMKLGRLDEAKEAFDKYLELKPEEPNPYDSKGDYYMEVGDYQKAYDNYMMAMKVDSTWKISLEKATNAKSIIARTPNE